MGKYFVRYFIESPNAIGSRNDIENGKVLGWKFNFGSNEIGLYDHKQGLWADCYIEAESQLRAEEKSKIFIENILNLIDFSTSSASNSPLFISTYEATDDYHRAHLNKFFILLFQIEIFLQLIEKFLKKFSIHLIRIKTQE
jgi:hypothetical protein